MIKVNLNFIDYNNDSEKVFIIFAGMNVKFPKISNSSKKLAKNNYHFDFPFRLVDNGFRVIEVYHPATNNIVPTYNQEQINETLFVLNEFLKFQKVKATPITHSLMTIAGFELSDKLNEKKYSQFLPPVNISYVTNADDASKDKKMYGLNLYDLFLFLDKIPINIPVPYPFANNFYHTNVKQTLPIIPYLGSKSASYMLNLNGFDLADKISESRNPLSIITLDDKIFSSVEQLKIAKKLSSEDNIIYANTGHCLFREDYGDVIERIVNFDQRNREKDKV